jgi:hypothetical protein
VATLSLLDDQVTLLSAAFSGVTVAVRVFDASMLSIIELGSIVTPVTFTVEMAS